MLLCYIYIWLKMVKVTHNFCLNNCETEIVSSDTWWKTASLSMKHVESSKPMISEEYCSHFMQVKTIKVFYNLTLNKYFESWRIYSTNHIGTIIKVPKLLPIIVKWKWWYIITWIVRSTIHDEQHPHLLWNLRTYGLRRILYKRCHYARKKNVFYNQWNYFIIWPCNFIGS